MKDSRLGIKSSTGLKGFQFHYNKNTNKFIFQIHWTTADEAKHVKSLSSDKNNFLDNFNKACEFYSHMYPDVQFNRNNIYTRLLNIITASTSKNLLTK